MRTCPALEIGFTPEAETDLSLRDRLQAGLDDFRPTAMEEAISAWRVFFDSASSRESALRWLRDDLADRRLTIDLVDIPDEDWVRRSQAGLGPVRAGRVVIAPPWSVDEATRDADPAGVVIVIVPSTGFGTGHHASTRLCLTLMQRVPLEGRAVLDVGTGSGVLALAAARLGARAVDAVDNDPDAIQAAIENLALNPTDVPVNFEQRDLRDASRGSFDVVLANLTGHLLQKAAADLVSRLAPAGVLIVSGVLDEQRAAVVSAFESAGARLSADAAEDEWVGLAFERR
jgi:ribosomal protein L11 methyltransferase